MFRKIAIAALLGSALTLGACATDPTTGQPTLSIDPTVLAQVQQDAATVCGFVPTVGTVASIIASLVPGGGAIATIATQTATQICAAVAPPKASLRRAGRPMVNGIPVEGYFIR